MKLLFTSSDPGSAQQNNVIATFFKKRNNAIIGYISSQVASKYYSSNFDKILCFPFPEQIDDALGSRVLPMMTEEWKNVNIDEEHDLFKLDYVFNSLKNEFSYLIEK